MTERKSSSLMPVVAVLAAVALLLVIYVGGYVRLGNRHVVKGFASGQPAPVVAGVVRLYPHKWQVTVFQPAAYIESRCLGVQVLLGDFDTYGDPNEENF